MKIADVPAKFPIPFAANAGGGFVNAIPEASQPGGRASLNDGFPPPTFTPPGAGGTPPFGSDFNGIIKQITQWSRWQNAGAQVKYDSAFSTAIGGYPFGAILVGAAVGVVWLCTVDDNTSNPDAGGAGWLNIGAQASPFYVGTDSGSANVMTATVSPTPTEYVDGNVYYVTKNAAPNAGAMIGNIQAIGNKPIVQPNGSALVGGQWPGGYDGILIYNLATDSLRLLNVAPTSPAGSGIAVSPQAVITLNIPGLPTPVGALALTDKAIIQSGADGKPVGALLSALQTLLFGPQLLAATGYKFFGPFLLQWGRTVASPPKGNVSITFPIAFPTACFGAFPVVENATSAQDCEYGMQVVSKTTTGVVMYNNNYSDAGGAGVLISGYEWIAIGM